MGCIPSVKQSKSELIKKQTMRVSIKPGMFTGFNQGHISQNYKEVRKIGEGAFAQVFLCIHHPTQEKRAIKAIHKSGLHYDQLDTDKMLKEINVLKSLDHPNILRCYEIFEDKMHYYVAVEYCDGGELFTKLAKMKIFSEEQASRIMLQLLSAVSYCHERKVIHRDLKPENILLMESDETLSIKVADFGSSVILDSKKKLSGCFGSAYYIAPEVLLGDYNEKCDIWSCGIIMYIMLTGKAPYRGQNQSNIVRAIKLKPFQPTSENCSKLSSAAIDLLKKMLDVDHVVRISAKQAMTHDWIQQHRKQSVADLAASIHSLEGFISTTKIKDAVHMFLASQVINHEECRILTEQFKVLDKNSDGKISKEELIENYCQSLDKDEAVRRAEYILSQVDVNGNGEIDYTEFLSACMNFKNYLSKETLYRAFQMFDVDRSGFITVEELKMVLGDGNSFSEDVWKALLKQVDTNGDGVIEFNEFLELMIGKNN
jgi:calcium-dependent protein kinase